MLTKDGERDGCQRAALEFSSDGGGDWALARPASGVWAGAGSKPHLVVKFKVSNDPHFADAATNVVGLR